MMVRGYATTSWHGKTTRGQRNERKRRGNVTTSWRNELTRWWHNERTTRGDATTSWHDEVTRGRHNERQLNLIVFRVQTESTGKGAAMVVARIEQKPKGWGTGEENEEVGNVVPYDIILRRHCKETRAKMELSIGRVLRGHN